MKTYLHISIVLWVFINALTSSAQTPIETKKKQTKIEFIFKDGFLEASTEKQTISKLTKEEKKVSILWWNVFRQGVSPLDLNKNLLAFILPPHSVDMIVLGEFDANKTLHPKVLFEIIKRYPYFEYFHYNDNFDDTKARSILVASKFHPKDRTYEKGGLKWSDPKETKKEQKEFIASWKEDYASSTTDWERAFIALSFTAFDKDFSIVPVHLANPWAVVKNVHNYDSFGVSSVVCAGCSVVFGDDNPLSNQIEGLQDKIIKKFKNKKNHTVSVFGDFNMPRSVMRKNTSSYNFLIKSMKDTKKEHVITFPTSLAEKLGNKTPHVEIDHCFCFPKNTTNIQSHTLHLKGSDHYPMLIHIDLK